MRKPKQSDEEEKNCSSNQLGGRRRPPLLPRRSVTILASKLRQLSGYLSTPPTPPSSNAFWVWLGRTWRETGREERKERE
ncbi:unnamed protein product, partial [Prunus brigantina]